MKIKVLFVCLGNICRSPLAEGVFQSLVDEKRLNHKFEIDSCGTSAFHVGEPADNRMREVAFNHGVSLTSRARQFSPSDFDTFDYIIAMDQSNKKNMLSTINKDPKASLFLMRDFDLTDKSADVPDPYYGGLAGFENVFQIVYRSSENLLNHIQHEHAI